MIVKNGKTNERMDLTHTMYPCLAYMIRGELQSFEHKHSTMYGFTTKGARITLTDNNRDHEEILLKKNSYFTIPVRQCDVSIESDECFVVFKLGFNGMEAYGRHREELGRLSYIDGCSDSLLAYPPRLGDPSLNYLYFPPGIDQSFHTHPSIRIGCVIQGSGKSSLRDKEIDLVPGVMFALEEKELHRFRTSASGDVMKIIAFHPDGDWGPTDENHTMLNRTYIAK